jgi:hypothetical protein
MEENRVLRNTRTTRSVQIFPWGNGHRVQYTHYSNSHFDSKLIAWHDEYYEDVMRAICVYQQFLYAAGIIPVLPNGIMQAIKAIGKFVPTDAEFKFMFLKG